MSIARRIEIGILLFHSSTVLSCPVRAVRPSNLVQFNNA